ncbi:BamA/TamA family outer membrane protein [Spirosoma soli]|uniref:BamA/TamA family outer membrane protein n=1 Tax=Spirosoma soli TaxID=1770529 RepID=A0ABW5M9K8_9BACT
MKWMYDLRTGRRNGASNDLTRQRRIITGSGLFVIRAMYRYVGPFVFLVLSLSGCLSSKQLRNNEYILTSQTIRGNRAITNEELESLIPQKPNRRILGLPITPPLWFYQLGQRRYNREAALRDLEAKTNEFEQQSQQLANQPRALKKLNRQYRRRLNRLRQRAEEGNWVMRNLGEPPSYFSENDARSNAGKMQKYLADKGFFNATTAYKLDTLRRRQIRVTYLISEKIEFYVRNVVYEIADPRVDSIVRQSLNSSLIKSSDRFDFDKLSAEKVRIESLLRDQGYYAFSRQYIRVGDIDTTRYQNERLSELDSVRRNLNVFIQIVNPPGQLAHPVYRIGDVEVRISPDETQPSAATAGLDTVRRNGITYLLGGRNISSRLLDAKILLRPGQLYSQTKYRDTQRQLFLLNQFKFVNLNFIDTTARRLRTLITATPLDKYEATAEGGITVLYQNQGYPGGFGNLIFRARNLFGGLETFETSLRYGIEAQTGFVDNEVYRAYELGISSSLTFPQLLLPGRFRFRFNPYAPRTQVSLGFTNTFRPDFQRTNLRTTLAYSWQLSSTKQFNVLLADISYLRTFYPNTIIGRSFEQFVQQQQEQGSTIYLAYRNAFVSGISGTYTYNTNVSGKNHRANFFRVTVESGGTTLNLLNAAFARELFDNDGPLFYKYLRGNIDYRYYMPLRPRTTLAFRINTGLAVGYAPNGAVPYEKLFFAGGSNSIRAWLPRRLGPGSAFPYIDNPNIPSFKDPPRQEQFDYRFEQPGNILLEGSAELRGRLFHLFGDVNGAIFVDAGNVWTLRDNPIRAGDVFRLNTFVPQIAVGTGVGLRFDFSFFIIRFDGGIKVWDPARRYPGVDNQIIDERFLLPKFSLGKLSKGPNPLVINFGIGYPF